MKLKAWLVGLLQTLGLAIYVSLVTAFIVNGVQWFGPLSGYFGPLLFLSLFSVSALICALLTFGYPFILIFAKKQTEKGVLVVGYTALWSLLALLLLLSYLCLH